MASTIKDIRKETGLALATISKYLNGGHVKPENQVKIEAAVKKLDYHPNEMARALITRKTRTSGFVVSDVAMQFCGMLLKYTGELLRGSGYSMIICDSANDEAIEAQNIRFCAEKNVDGILLIPISKNSDMLKPARDAGIPVVLLDRDIAGSGCDSVTIDNKNTAKQAVCHLIDRGHRKIAVIHSNEYTGKKRVQGYRSALKENGIGIRDEYIIDGPIHSTRLGYEGMKKLLALQDPPTAVFMTNYEVSLGVIMALNEGGIVCPDQISILGFDELILSLVMKPKITVVGQPMDQICKEAVGLLMNRMTEKTEYSPKRIRIYASLKEGASVKRI